MRNNKILLLIMFLLFNLNSRGQVVITEINYDTPFLESIYHYTDNYLPNPTPFLHHMGEFIELYNYTTEDIPLTGWYIADRVTRYDFPANAVIKSGDYIIVAYGTPEYGPYFTTFFPNAIGQEDKIFYQDKIMLNNFKENVKLYFGKIRMQTFQNQIISNYNWQYANNHGEWDHETSYSSYTNYYSNSSFHLDNINPVNYHSGTATPFGSSYTIPLIELEDSPLINALYYDNYADLNWDQILLALLNNLCSLSVIDIEQIDSNTYLTTGKCFNYDISGNYTDAVDCNPTEDVTNPSTEYTPEQIENFSSIIVISPNPTNSNSSATWSGDVLGKITEVQIANMNGTSILTQPISPTQDAFIINLGGQPSGIYIIRFILDSGQFISKNVIKI